MSTISLENHRHIFHFKEFSIIHERSAMKVGVDGVLLGAWANVKGEDILDVGCGCGLIAIMAAQRNADASILGIDIDTNAVEEATENARSSRWNERLEIVCRNFEQQIDISRRFDCIISNPPFFNSGILHPSTKREKSRHTDTLSPEIIIFGAKKILRSSGSISLITPTASLPSMHLAAEKAGMYCHRLTEVVTVQGKIAKRVLTEWRLLDDSKINSDNHVLPETLCEKIFIETGTPENRHFSEKYINLCQPFYLHM